jgi:hypothetical protein
MSIRGTKIRLKNDSVTRKEKTRDVGWWGGIKEIRKKTKENNSMPRNARNLRNNV